MSDTFKSSGYEWRLFCGSSVIESSLANIVVRSGATRALVLCSPSINRKTDIVTRIAIELGDRLAGVFDELEKDSTFASVQAAREAAMVAKADLLIAVGGGSAIVATRAVAIFLAEAGDPHELMTQYPMGSRPFSPKLTAKKLPIINIPTTPTSAMNRAGTGLKNPSLTHRMEYFDPKTRPIAILIDDQVLLTTPFDVMRSTATTVFAGTVGALAHTDPNPLVEGDHRQAFRLANRAYRRISAERSSPDLRRDLCLAAFLQNRAEDDGRSMLVSGAFSGDYAVSTALHVRYPHIGQGESTSVFQGHVIRMAETLDERQARCVAEGLGMSVDGMEARRTGEAVAAELDSIYRDIGLPGRLRDMNVPKEDIPSIAAETVKNFNARNSATSEQQRLTKSMRLLEMAW